MRRTARISLTFTFAVALAVAACASGDRTASPAAARSPASAPEGARAFDAAAPPAGAAAAAVSRADAAIGELQRRLGARLAQALQEGGPSGAVSVCREDAPRLAAEVGREHGVRIGRTSDRLRNPGNAPPGWARAAVDAAAGLPASDVRPVALDLGDRLGVLRPIAVGPACTRCHGAHDALAPDVAARLQSVYPADRAVGYAPGDHRGFFWVEAAK